MFHDLSERFIREGNKELKSIKRSDGQEEESSVFEEDVVNGIDKVNDDEKLVDDGGSQSEKGEGGNELGGGDGGTEGSARDNSSKEIRIGVIDI